MRNNEKKKQIALIIAIVAVIVVGVIFFQKIWKSEDKHEEEISQPVEEAMEIDQEPKDERLYYIEESRGEEVFEDIRHIWIMKFKDKPVRLSKNPESQKMSLMDMDTGDYIYEFPNEEMYKNDGLCIDENNVFWTIKYYNDLKQTIVKSFDETGQEANPPLILENFKIAEGFDEYDDEDLYLDIRNMNTDNKNLYFSGHALKRRDESCFQAYTKGGALLKTFISANRGIELDKDGNLFLATEGKTYFEGEETETPDLYGNYCIKFDVNTFEKIYQKYEDTVITDISYNQSMDKVYALCPFKEGKIVAYKGEDGENLGEVFILGKDSSYTNLDPNYWIWDFRIGDNEEVYFSLRGSDENGSHPYKFFAYREKEKRYNSERPVTLTITAPFKQDSLANAIKVYEIKYPEEKVEYNYIYNNGEQFLKHREKYSEQLAMDILTGEIGDIVATGAAGLVYQDVFRTDVFEDLAPYLKKDPSYDELNKNALKAIKIDNAIRGLPVSFSYYFYEINEELADELELNVDYNHLKWSDVLKWTKVIEKKAPDAHLFVGVNPKESVLNEILMANIPDLIDLKKKKADLHQKWFVDLMREFKECYKSKNFALDSPLGMQLERSFHGSLLRFMSNYGKNYRDQMKYFCESNLNGTKKIYIPLFAGEKNDNRRAYSDNMYSINARSDRKESAWKFLRFLLEQDMQQDSQLKGTPLNVAAERKLGTRYKSQFENQYPMELLEKFENSSMKSSKKIDFFYDVNHFKKDIEDPITQYLNDKITLVEAIKKAQENVDLRLNE